MTRRAISGWVPLVGLAILVLMLVLLTACGTSTATGDSGDSGTGDPHGNIHYLTVQCVGQVQYGSTGDHTLTAVLDPKDCP